MGFGRKLRTNARPLRAPAALFRDTTHERAPSTPHAIDAKNTTRNTAPTHRRRSLFQELAKKFSDAVRPRRAAIWACSGGAR